MSLQPTKAAPQPTTPTGAVTAGRTITGTPVRAFRRVHIILRPAFKLAPRTEQHSLNRQAPQAQGCEHQDGAVSECLGLTALLATHNGLTGDTNKQPSCIDVFNRIMREYDAECVGSVQSSVRQPLLEEFGFRSTKRARIPISKTDASC